MDALEISQLLCQAVVRVVLPVMLSLIVASMLQFLSKSLIFSSNISALSGVIGAFILMVNLPAFIYDILAECTKKLEVDHCAVWE